MRRWNLRGFRDRTRNADAGHHDLKELAMMKFSILVGEVRFRLRCSNTPSSQRANERRGEATMLRDGPALQLGNTG